MDFKEIVKLILACMQLIVFDVNAKDDVIESTISAINNKNYNAIVLNINEIKKLQNSQEIRNFSLNLWNGKHDKYKNLDWEIVNLPEIKIELANVIIQYRNNGFAIYDTDKMDKYLIAFVEKNPNNITGILSAGLNKSRKAIPILEKIAVSENKKTFRSAIIALNSICEIGGKEALNSVKKELKNNSNIEFIDSYASDCIASN